MRGKLSQIFGTRNIVKWYSVQPIVLQHYSLKIGRLLLCSCSPSFFVNSKWEVRLCLRRVSAASHIIHLGPQPLHMLSASNFFLSYRVPNIYGRDSKNRILTNRMPRFQQPNTNWPQADEASSLEGDKGIRMTFYLWNSLNRELLNAILNWHRCPT